MIKSKIIIAFICCLLLLTGMTPIQSIRPEAKQVAVEQEGTIIKIYYNPNNGDFSFQESKNDQILKSVRTNLRQKRLQKNLSNQLISPFSVAKPIATEAGLGYFYESPTTTVYQCSNRQYKSVYQFRGLGVNNTSSNASTRHNLEQIVRDMRSLEPQIKGQLGGTLFADLLGAIALMAGLAGAAIGALLIAFGLVGNSATLVKQYANKLAEGEDFFRLLYLEKR